MLKIAKAGGNLVKREDRKQAIMDLLVEQHAVDLDDLAERFAVSKMTIHRDLDDLESEGLLRKMRGGATIESGTQFESDFRFRARQEGAAKARMARAALELIEPGSEPVEHAELVQHCVAQFARVDVDEAAAEADEVGVRHVSTDRDAAVGRRLADTTQRRWVAGMESARDVRTGDEVEHCVVVTQGPGAVRLTQVGVEVDRCHAPSVDAGRR